MIDKSDEKLYNELSHQMDDKKGEDIMAKNKHLSDLIYAKFKTESACARHMGWTKQRLNKITNGKKSRISPKLTCYRTHWKPLLTI